MNRAAANRSPAATALSQISDMSYIRARVGSVALSEGRGQSVELLSS